MLKLTEEDKLKLVPKQWDRTIKVDLSSGPCYAKFSGNTGVFRELFGKKIFDIVGISSADYAFYKEKNCIVSTDLAKKYENFKQATEYADIYNLGELHNVAKKFNNYDELCIQINIMHFMDILFGNSDRHSDNYGFSVDKNNNARLVVLDNELMLEDFYHASRPVAFPSKSHLAFVSYSHESEFNFFINNLSDNQRELIHYYLQKFTPKNVYMIMNSIEKENNCKFKEKRKLFYKYVKNYISIYKLYISSQQTKKELK